MVRLGVWSNLAVNRRPDRRGSLRQCYRQMLLLAILLAFGTVAAFTTMNNNIRVGQIFSETTTRKEALVFYPDDDDGCNIDDSTNNNEMSSLFFNNEHFNFDYNDSNLDLLDRITHTVSQSTLARISNRNNQCE